MTTTQLLSNNQEHLNSFFSFLSSRNLECTQENMLLWVNSTAKKMKELSENKALANRMYKEYAK